MTAFLLKFEKSLTTIGANEIYLKELRAGPERTKVVTLVYDEFKKLMSLEKLPDGSDTDVAVAYILNGLREHLGIAKLTMLRKHAIEAAMKRIK